MAQLVWDQTGQKEYETGCDRGVLYRISNNAYAEGFAWNGLIGFDESPSGAEPSKLYADNINYATMYSAEEYGGTIRAYTYPDAFEECNGEAALASGVIVAQQARKPFGFSYRTLVGNDTEGTAFGYKIHCVYGCQVSPSSKTHDTVNDSPSAVEMSWELTSTPVNVGTGFTPTSVVEIDSTKLTSDALKGKLAVLETILYGGDFAQFDATKTYAVGDTVTQSTKSYVCTTAVETAGAFDEENWTEVESAGPRLPLPAEIKELFTVA